MDDNTVEQGSGTRWLLPIGLVILILLILGGAFLATHRNLFAAKATATPTPLRITATPRPATATPKPGPTGTPRPGPTGTPKPGPTSAPRATSRPAPSATPFPTAKPSPTALNGVHAGTFTHTQAEVNAIQQGSNRGESAYTFYTDPFRVVTANLPHYNFNGPFSIVAPPTPPAATPTPVTNAQGQPSVTITVSYRGAKYAIILVQPVQHGPKGIWVIQQIKVV
jgi:hypothetical protein